MAVGPQLKIYFVCSFCT